MHTKTLTGIIPVPVPVLGLVLGLGLGLAAVQPALAEETGIPGTTAEKGSAASPGVRLPVAFSAPAKGFVSLALFNPEGVLVRSLLHAQPVEAGTHTVMWDGTTDMGKPAPAGTYTAKGIYFENPPTVKLNMFLKSGNPPWRTADGKGDWGANLGPGTSIVSDGKTIIAGYACVEDNQITGVQQMDGDGNISLRYFTFFTYDNRCAAAMDGANYYLGLWCGGYYGQRKGLLIAAYTQGNPKGKILCELPAEPKEIKIHGLLQGTKSTRIDGLALTKDTLYAAVMDNDAIFVVDRQSGEVRKTIQVPQPQGVIVVGDSLLVVSGKKVLRLTLTGEADRPFVDEGVLQAPSAIARDAAGNVYVSDGGNLRNLRLDAADATCTRQVHVFTPEGKPLRRIGKPGGAPKEGRFDENGLGLVTSLCIGPGVGGTGEALWVTDIATGFQRTSRWSLDGKLERQWFHREHQLWSDKINPARPGELLHTSAANYDLSSITAYAIDLKTRAWKPSWHYRMPWNEMWQEDVVLGNTHPHHLQRYDKTLRTPMFHYGAVDKFVTYKGRNYFMNSNGNMDGGIYLYSPDQRPKPVALVGFHRYERRTDGKLETAYMNGKVNNWLTWADRSGDGKMSADEITLAEDSPLLKESSGKIQYAMLDDNLNVLLQYTPTTKMSGPAWAILPLKELLPNGVPVYDYTMIREFAPRLEMPDLSGGDGWKKISSYSTKTPHRYETPEGIYALVAPAYDISSTPDKKRLNLGGIDGDGWWASRNWRTRVTKFDKTTGKCLWAVGNRAAGVAQPGQMYHPAHLAGVAGGAVFVTDTLGPIWAWSTEGFFLGNIFRNTMQLARTFKSEQSDDQYLYGETQTSQVYADPESGKIYHIVNDQAAHIHEVLLPKTTPLTPAVVTLGNEQARQAAAWDPDGVVPTRKPEFTVYHGTPDILKGTGWDRGPEKPRILEEVILLDGQGLAGVRALYDKENLYLQYNVRIPNGMINSGSEFPLCPFVSGAYVDFYLGPDWDGPRAEVRDGDVRVILSQSTGKDFQQGFWQKKKGGTSPQVIVSGVAELRFDQISEVPGLKMKITPRGKDPVDKDGRHHFTVAVSVPLASLGLKNPAGKRVGFDMSVAIANRAGDRRERAGHWAGMSEAVVVDRPGSMVLLPDNWGTLYFAPEGE